MSSRSHSAIHALPGFFQRNHRRTTRFFSMEGPARRARCICNALVKQVNAKRHMSASAIASE